MSFDIFLACYRDGENATFPHEIVRRAFAPYILEIHGGLKVDPEAEVDSQRWALRFKDGGRCDVYINAEGPIGGFMVNRPPGSPAFWDALIDIMKQTDTVLFWPDGGAVVAKESVVAHMPPDMIEVMGRPKVTIDMKEIHGFIGMT